jgi:hypothetical protein
MMAYCQPVSRIICRTSFPQSFTFCVDSQDHLQVLAQYCRMLWRFGLRSVIFLPRFYIAPFAWRVRSRIIRVSHRLHPILQPCLLWPFPFLERLVDAVLSSKINHPGLAQPKPMLERFELVEQFRYRRPVKYTFHILNLDNGDADNVLFRQEC